MPPLAQNVSVTLPVSQAMSRVKLMLFQPFDMARWFAIGFCAWLALLGQGGFHGGGNFNFGGHHGRGLGGVRDAFGHARDYVIQNLSWLVPLAATLLLVGLCVWLLVLWVSSRGQFMFLHCVARNQAEVVAPWHRYPREGNSLFRFRLALALAGMITVLPLVAGAVLLVWRMVDRGTVSVGGVMGGIGLTLGLITLGIVFGLVAKLTRDFVVPIQLIHGGSSIRAWGTLLGLVSANFGHIILYLLFQIVLALAIFVLVVTLVLATCCIAGCLFALPYVGTVLLLPVLTFERAYSAYYLAQYGPDFDVFGPSATAPPTGT